MDEMQENVGLDNSSEVVETEPDNISDNSEGQVQEPENTENAEENTETQGKFKTLEDATKSYEELQKKLGEQSNELGELRKFKEETQKQIDSEKLAEANSKGFETVRDYENHKEMTKFEANAYRQHISECDFPDEMESLLQELEKNPTKELRDTIKSQFSLETIEHIAGEKKLFEGQLAQREQQALYNELESSARGYLDETVPKYAKEFENPAFNLIFGEAFRAFGCDLDAEALVNILHQYVEYANKASNIQSEINKENSKATDAIAGVANTGGGKGISGTNLLNMSDEAAANRLGELI